MRICAAEPYAARRERWRRHWQKAEPPIHLTPVTDQADVARDWFSRFEGAGLDGVVVKAADLTTNPTSGR